MKTYLIQLGLGQPECTVPEMATEMTTELSDDDAQLLDRLMGKYKTVPIAHFNELPEVLAESLQKQMIAAFDREIARGLLYNRFEEFGKRYHEAHYFDDAPSWYGLTDDECIDFILERYREKSIANAPQYDIAKAYICELEEIVPRITKKYRIDFWSGLYYCGGGEEKLNGYANLTDDELQEVNAFIDKYKDDASAHLDELSEVAYDEVTDALFNGFKEMYLDNTSSEEDWVARELYNELHGINEDEDDTEEDEDDDTYYGPRGSEPEPEGWDALSQEEKKNFMVRHDIVNFETISEMMPNTTIISVKLAE